MSTFRKLIDDYGLAAFAADLGVSENTAKQMRKRDSVAPQYWATWVRKARERGKTSITPEHLMALREARSQRIGSPEQGRAA